MLPLHTRQFRRRYLVRRVRVADGWRLHVDELPHVSGWVAWRNDVEPAARQLIAAKTHIHPAGVDVQVETDTREALAS